MESSKKMVREFKEYMLNSLEITDLGLLQYFLGLGVKQNEGDVFVYKKKIFKERLKIFDMQNFKTISTTMRVSERL